MYEIRTYTNSAIFYSNRLNNTIDQLHIYCSNSKADMYRVFCSKTNKILFTALNTFDFNRSSRWGIFIKYIPNINIGNYMLYSRELNV